LVVKLPKKPEFCLFLTWLLRYDGDRATPHIWLPYELTEADDAKLQANGMKRGSGNTIRLDRPEHITRLFSYLGAALS